MDGKAMENMTIVFFLDSMLLYFSPFTFVLQYER